jgi:hypothetical protein
MFRKDGRVGIASAGGCDGDMAIRESYILTEKSWS